MKPVVASDVPHYMRRDAAGVRVVSDTDLSGIRAGTPDVILGTKEANGDEYGDLSKIAPTILSEGDDWKLNVRLHGEALGRTNDAEGLLVDWDNRVARVRRQIGEPEDHRAACRRKGALGRWESRFSPTSASAAEAAVGGRRGCAAGRNGPAAEFWRPAPCSQRSRTPSNSSFRLPYGSTPV